MTIKDVLLKFMHGEYADVEVYRPRNTGDFYPDCFHTDNCDVLSADAPAGNFTENMEVGFYGLLSEREYNATLLVNSETIADFEDWYGDKNAKVLCIMIK